MNLRRSSRILAGAAVALVLAGSVSWAPARPALAQASPTSCPVQAQPAQGTGQQAAQ